MGKVTVSAVALVCGLVGAVNAQTRDTGSFKNHLVQAQCLSGPVPVPCDSGVVFKNGFLRIKRLKQPKLVQNTVVGKIRIQQVTPVQPAGLDAIVRGLVSYGSDPDSDCPLANTQVLVDPLLTSTMTCQTTSSGLSSNCKGLLQFPQPGGNTPPQCSDVRITVENVQAEVYEDGSVGNINGLIARNGMVVLGRSPDCNSGGANCP